MRGARPRYAANDSNSEPGRNVQRPLVSSTALGNLPFMRMICRAFVVFGTATACLASPAAAQDRLKPVIQPARFEQGIDMILVDADVAPPEPELGNLALAQEARWRRAPIDPSRPANRLYADLHRQLVRYQADWGGLPQVPVPVDNEVMTLGSSDPRIILLRERLGLTQGGGFDQALQAKLAAYQETHGLPADGKAGPQTLVSLNRGAGYYEKLILLNMERARRLPSAAADSKYVIVDMGAARLWMYEGGRAKDSMRVIVGKAGTPTPMMAAYIRYVSLNPYWNVPLDLARTLVAKKVLAEGLGYLKERDYELLSDWTSDATPVDPSTINWRSVADGEANIRIRRRPGPWNSMGQIKFMLPNIFGIYLHDVPDKSHFADQNRWLSNGCVRVEDAHRLAKWLFNGIAPPKTSKPDQRVDLPKPVPVYFTYFTVESAAKGPVFRGDPYDWDSPLLARSYGSADDSSDLREPMHTADPEQGPAQAR